MGIFGRNIDKAYGSQTVDPLMISSPWAPQDQLVQFVMDDALQGILAESGVITREIALKVPGVKRAHGIVTAMTARIPFYLMNADVREADQPKWLTTSASGVSPYHRMVGLASDWFFEGWGCLGFNAGMTDCMHIPFGMWSIQSGRVVVDDPHGLIPPQYLERLVAIPVGYGENGLLNDGSDTIAQARKIESAYNDRLDNPVPLTVLGVPLETYQGWTDAERKSYRDQWVAGRKAGGVALKVAEFPVEMPGQTETNLYESGRNANRLDIANHTAMPAGLLEGLRQGGGGGTEIRYSSDVGGAHRNELWDFGLPARFVAAFEARMSLDDICAPGLSIRGDLSGELTAPNPTMNPTSED